MDKYEVVKVENGKCLFKGDFPKCWKFQGKHVDRMMIIVLSEKAARWYRKSLAKISSQRPNETDVWI